MLFVFHKHLLLDGDADKERRFVIRFVGFFTFHFPYLSQGHPQDHYLRITHRFKRDRKYQITDSSPTLNPVLIHNVEMPSCGCVCCHGVRTSLMGLSQGQWEKAQPLAWANCLCRGGKPGKTTFNSAKSLRRGRKPPVITPWICQCPCVYCGYIIIMIHSSNEN